MKTAKIDIYTPYGSRGIVADVSYRRKILRTFDSSNVSYASYFSSVQLAESIATSAKAWALGNGFDRVVFINDERKA